MKWCSKNSLWLSLTFVAAVAMSTGCASSKNKRPAGNPVAMQDSLMLQNTTWYVTDVASLDLPLEQRKRAYFSFKKGRITGSTGCNQFFADYLWATPSSILVRDPGATKRYCVSTERLESIFLKHLEQELSPRLLNDTTLQLQSNSAMLITAVKGPAPKDK